MKENIELSTLSIEIAEKIPFGYTTEYLKKFDIRLNKIDIKEFIIHIFLNEPGTGLRELILSTFKYWQRLNYNDWKYIFKKIEGNHLGEYYMNPISKAYLGIDPRFKSSKGFRERIFTKKYRQTEKADEFIGYSKNDIWGVSVEELEKDFLNINSLIEYSDKLLNELNESYLSVK